MRSMTGFGRAEGEACGLFVEIVIRSVNHKSLDLNIRMPRRLYPLERDVREIIQAKVFRGRVEVSVQLRPSDMPLTTLKLDTARVDAASRALDEMIHRLSLTDHVRLQDLLRVPDLLIEEPAQLDEDSLKEQFLAILQEALDGFLAMREEEAKGLGAQLRKNLAGIHESIRQLEQKLPELREEARARLLQKVEDFLRDNPDQQDGRLQQELLFYLDKTDVQEELTRLDSHGKQFTAYLDAQGPIGKKLDFLAQEMNREANTIASKSQHLTQTDAAINLKVHVEQMREQILNLE